MEMFRYGAKSIPGDDCYVIIDGDYYIIDDEYSMTHYMAVTVLGILIFNNSFNLPVRSLR